MLPLRTVALALLLTVTAGCSDGAEPGTVVRTVAPTTRPAPEPSVPPTDSTVAPTTKATTTSPTSMLPVPMPAVVDLALADLALAQGVEPGRIEVVAVADVIWPNTCLGLPSPELCVPGETPGFTVTLRLDGAAHVYHTDIDDTIRYAGRGD